MEENRPNYYAIIPANVRYDATLRPNAKLLYAEITALCNAKGCCWSSNAYFAMLFSVSKKTISSLLSTLTDAGYIKIKIIRNADTKQIEKRLIYVAEIPETDADPMPNFEHTSPQNCGEPIPKNEEVYNRMNITSINTNPIAPKIVLNRIEEYANCNQSLYDAFYAFLDNRSKMHKQVHTLRAINGIIKQLDEISESDDNKKIKLLDTATMRNWQMIYSIDKHSQAPSARVEESEALESW